MATTQHSIDLLQSRWHYRWRSVNGMALVDSDETGL